MTAKYETPKTESVDRPGNRDATRTTHPAFGNIGASRVQTTGIYLYGSDFRHASFVSIRIRRSELERSLSHDDFFGKDPIVEVRLSEAQWATFVSTLNVGDGVPCTIGAIGSESVPMIDRPKETEERFRSEVAEKAARSVERVDETIRRVEALASGLSKKKKEETLGLLRTLRQDLASNLPFVVRSFGEHVETRVEKAKVEVSAYVSNAVARAGLRALGGKEPEVLSLPPSSRDLDELKELEGRLREGSDG